jgi:hypothetical protein
MLLGDIHNVAEHIPALIRESVQCAAILMLRNKMEQLLLNIPLQTTFYCLYGTYSVTLQELKAVS